MVDQCRFPLDNWLSSKSRHATPSVVLCQWTRLARDLKCCPSWSLENWRWKPECSYCSLKGRIFSLYLRLYLVSYFAIQRYIFYVVYMRILFLDSHWKIRSLWVTMVFWHSSKYQFVLSRFWYQRKINQRRFQTLSFWSEINRTICHLCYSFDHFSLIPANLIMTTAVVPPTFWKPTATV